MRKVLLDTQERLFSMDLDGSAVNGYAVVKMMLWHVLKKWDCKIVDGLNLGQVCGQWEVAMLREVTQRFHEIQGKYLNFMKPV
jgi:hypothetical protein